MTEPTFKGVVFDVDGMLLTSRNAVSHQMLTVCHALTEMEIWLSIARARSSRSILLTGNMIEASGLCSALNGAVILAHDEAILQRLST